MILLYIKSLTPAFRAIVLSMLRGITNACKVNRKLCADFFVHSIIVKLHLGNWELNFRRTGLLMMAVGARSVVSAG